MKKIHFKLSFIILLIFIQGCTTNDSNSFLVRWWNDGFIMTEKNLMQMRAALGKLTKLILPRHQVRMIGMVFILVPSSKPQEVIKYEKDPF